MIYTPVYVVQVSVDSINAYAMPDSLDNRSLHVILTGQTFKSAKNYRVMGYNQIKPAFDGFVDNGFCTIERDEYSLHFVVDVAGEKACIVVRLLVLKRSDGFKVTGDVFYA